MTILSIVIAIAGLYLIGYLDERLNAAERDSIARKARHGGS